MHGRTAIMCMMALLVAPIGAAQELPEALEESDARGDVKVSGPGAGEITASEDFGHLDLLGARIHKEPPGMHFGISVADASALYSGSEDGLVRLFFQFDTVAYATSYNDEAEEVCLHKIVEGTGELHRIRCSEATLDGDWVGATFPKEDIENKAGAALRHPAQLSDVFASSYDRIVLGGQAVGSLEFEDRAPDTGSWRGLETAADPTTNPILLTPVSPIRSSNGGADVLVFQVEIDNTLTSPVAPLMTVNDVPEGWSIKAPARVDIDAGSTLSVPVVVTLPGNHQHGTMETFLLEASTKDLRSTTELGVQFLEVPQPAGHHSQLFLHGRVIDEDIDGTQFQAVWMNTIEEPEGADPDAALRSNDQNRDVDIKTDAWHFELAPQLALGLDFIVPSDVQARFALQSDVDVTLEYVDARVKYCDPMSNSGYDGGEHRCQGTWFTLAEASARDVPVGTSPTNVEMSLPVAEHADLLPYIEDSLLAFEVTAARAVPDVGDVLFLPGDASVELPLLEYTDPVDVSFQAIDSITLNLQNASRIIPPGGTAWYEVSATNTDSTKHRLALSLTGTNAAWATVVHAPSQLDAGETASIHIRLDVPESAREGELAEIVVVAEDPESPHVVSLQRMDAEVSASGSSDAAPDLPPDKASPSPWLGLAVLGAVLIARRR